MTVLSCDRARTQPEEERQGPWCRACRSWWLIIDQVSSWLGKAMFTTTIGRGGMGAISRRIQKRIIWSAVASKVGVGSRFATGLFAHKVYFRMLFELFDVPLPMEVSGPGCSSAPKALSCKRPSQTTDRPPLASSPGYEMTSQRHLGKTDQGRQRLIVTTQSAWFCMMIAELAAHERLLRTRPHAFIPSLLDGIWKISSRWLSLPITAGQLLAGHRFRDERERRWRKIIGIVLINFKGSLLRGVSRKFLFRLRKHGTYRAQWRIPGRCEPSSKSSISGLANRPRMQDSASLLLRPHQ